MNVPAYHIGMLKGYLSGQNAPAEIFVAAEALYIAAIQGPLRTDAIEAINLVAQAAEKLMAGSFKNEASSPIAITAQKVKTPPKPATSNEQQDEIVLPALTRRALEMANRSIDAAIVPPVDDGGIDSDMKKVDEFIRTKGPTRCPPVAAIGGDYEAVAGVEQPKKRNGWSQEARAAAADRMKARMAAKVPAKR